MNSTGKFTNTVSSESRKRSEFFLNKTLKMQIGKTLSASATITNVVSKNTSLHIRK